MHKSDGLINHKTNMKTRKYVKQTLVKAKLLLQLYKHQKINSRESSTGNLQYEVLQHFYCTIHNNSCLDLIFKTSIRESLNTFINKEVSTISLDFVKVILDYFRWEMCAHFSETHHINWIVPALMWQPISSSESKGFEKLWSRALQRNLV